MVPLCAHRSHPEQPVLNFTVTFLSFIALSALQLPHAGSVAAADHLSNCFTTTAPTDMFGPVPCAGHSQICSSCFLLLLSALFPALPSLLQRAK
jgi:hypothetical protein